MASQSMLLKRPDSGWRVAIMGALVLAAASTLGDFIWALWIPRHRLVYGAIHGTLLFFIMGLYLGLMGRSRRSLVLGALGGPTVGLIAALSFYAISPLLRRHAMFIAWVFLWILLGLLQRQILQDGETVQRALLRGGIAAVSSGIVFYLISGIWLGDTRNPNYLYNFVCWTVAYLPGFLALLVRRR